MAKTLPASAQEYKDNLVSEVRGRIEEGQPVSGKDLLALNGYVEIFDPALGAKKQVKIEDAYEFLKSLDAIAENA